MLKVPTRLMFTTRWNTSSGCGPSLPTVFTAGATPAQLISPTTVPSDCAAATTALPSASEVTSHFTNLPPSSAASFSPASICKSASTTLPPFSTIMRADAAPKPEAPPVTIKTWFLISIVTPSDKEIERGSGLWKPRRAASYRHQRQRQPKLPLSGKIEESADQSLRR